MADTIPKIPWTDPQRAAIGHVGGDLLVSAAAGSGKTAVLAERCARLVCTASHATGIDNLLVVTFTEAAAGEMRTRIARALDQAVRGPADDAHAAWLRRQAAMVERASISTLHAFCARILRQHFHEADVDPAFAVMDQDDARLMREEVLQELLARWHTLPEHAPELPVDGARFTACFESYAQGNEGSLGRQILALHRMLATTADPAAYVHNAREVYGAGAQAFFAAYSSETLVGKLRQAHLAADRACREVESVLHTESMHVPLRDARRALEDAMEMLAAKGAAAWSPIAESLKLNWPRLKRIDAVDDFDRVKSRTWQKMKDVLANLVPPFERDAARMLADLRSLAGPLDTLLALTADFEQAFAAAKRDENCLDFNDLERFTLNMLRRPDGAVAAELRRRYHYVLVDEFQDINPLQGALLDAVRNPAAFGGHGNYFRVGDVKQSIYGFRLAEPRLFLKQERAARDADAAEAAQPGRGSAASRRLLALPHNFRSRPELITAMNGMFARLLTPAVAEIDYRDGHALQAPPELPAVPPHQGPAVEVHVMVTSNPAREQEHAEKRDPDDEPAAEQNFAEPTLPLEQEARMVAQRVAGLLAEGRTVRLKDGTTRALGPSDIAVLLRAMKDRAMIFARAFARAGIPLHAELSTGYFDAPEIANTLALLQVLDNPEQDIPLATVLLGPYGNFAHDDLALIRLTYDRAQVPFAVAAARYAHDATDAGARAAAETMGLLAPHAPAFSDDLAARLRHLLAQLETWRSWLHTRPLHEGLAEIYAASKILVYVAGLEAGPQRVANLQQLHRRALAFSSFRKQGLHRFLRFLERLREEESFGGGSGDTGAAMLSKAADSVRLMSIHKSKGLEFPVVIIAGLGSPMRLQKDQPMLHRELGIGLDVIDLPRQVRYDSAATLRIADALDRAQRAEELRLLYVAMTRARDTLVLSGCISKEEKLSEWRAAWSRHAGPLPEDMLLQATRPLDWVMPAVAALGVDGIRVAWSGENSPADAQVSVTVHTKDIAAPPQTPPAPSEIAARLLAGAPLPAVPVQEQVERLFAQLGQVYPHAAAAARAAVYTVTLLKGMQPPLPEEVAETVAPDLRDLAPGPQRVDRDQAPHRAPPEPVATPAHPASEDSERQARSEAARLRGIATHRVLELLDLADVTPAAVEKQKAVWLQRRSISQEDIARADWTGIRWFLTVSETGRRLRAAASSAPETIVRREIPFACVAPADLLPTAASFGAAPQAEPQSQDPADLPTLRGIIDVLIATPAARAAEIIDYKTDAAFLVDQRLDAYRRQMRYYLCAAADILGYPVAQATLVFLAARREAIVPV